MRKNKRPSKVADS